MAVNISPYPRSPPFPAKAPLQLFPANTPITITQHAEEMGVAQPNTFASEFGCSVFSSFESMAPTLAEAHWGVHGGAPQADCREPDITNAFWRECKPGDPYPCTWGVERRAEISGLGARAAVSWPWVPAWGSLEPSRRGGENAQKTTKNGEKMGEIQPNKCEGGS